MSENYLVISLGSIGKRHLSNLRYLRPQARIGVLHLSGAPTSPMAEGVDCRFTSMDEALAFRPSAAIVCSPASTHLAVASALVQDGVPVLIEKPIAHESQGLAELLSLAEHNAVPLMTGYNMRFQPSLIEAHRMLKAGVLGEVLGVRAEVGQYLPDWRPGLHYTDSVSAHRALGGGALLELSHEIDYLYWMFGQPTRVVALGGRYSSLEIDVEDMVSLSLEYERPRRLVNIHLDFLQRSPSRTCKFIGSEGTLVWDGIADTIDTYPCGASEWSRVEVPPVPDKNGMYLAELSHFLHAVERRSVPSINGVQGLAVLRIIEAAKESIIRREAIELV
jgi:predicted dehydrogenase